MEWISVNNKLPDFEVEVLVFYRIKEFDYFDIAYVNSVSTSKAGRCAEWISTKDSDRINPTHWMPLPEPPK